MSTTNFALLTSNEKTVWSMEFWAQARNQSFINKFLGKDANSMIQHVTELKKTEKGARAVITLLADLEGDGIVGDRTLEGNEEAMKSYDQVIRIDQLRNATRHEGKMADQKSVVNFRENARDKLAYWLADRIDQMAFLMLSGISFEFKNNGAARPGGATGTLPKLVFHKITAPTTNRHLRVSGTNIAAGDTSLITAGDTLKYKPLVRAKAFLKDTGLRGLRIGYNDLLHVFVTTSGMADLRLDADFMAAVKDAGARGKVNPIFDGVDSIMVDGMMIHEYKYVYNTTGKASGQKWGSGGLVNGMRVLIMGAQALGFFDHGAPGWTEETFDYKNQVGIGTHKVFGMLKPVFHNDWTKHPEDYGVGVLDCALSSMA